MSRHIDMSTVLLHAPPRPKFAHWHASVGIARGIEHRLLLMSVASKFEVCEFTRAPRNCWFEKQVFWAIAGEATSYAIEGWGA